MRNGEQNITTTVDENLLFRCLVSDEEKQGGGS